MNAPLPTETDLVFPGLMGKGLTKRELFAVFSDQPGVAEIVTAAGLRCTDNFWVWKDAETKIGSFNDWWATLSNAERFALSAKVRVEQADALLKALGVTS